MRRMLIAIDGSEPSLRALDHGLDLAKECNGRELLLVNVEPRPVAWQTRGLAKEAIEAHLDELGQQSLAAATDRAARAGVPFRTRIARGDPAETIAALAAGEGVEVIIMGTRGYGAVAGLLLGSVATKVLHLARVPVTLVK